MSKIGKALRLGIELNTLFYYKVVGHLKKKEGIWAPASAW